MEELPQGDAIVSSEPNGTTTARRGFFAQIVAIAIGTFLFVFPFAVGLGTLLDPLRRKAKTGHDKFIRVAPVASLPADGTPVQFPIIADRDDAWARLPREPIGAVYVRRLKGSEKVQVFNAICPHLGCLVAFSHASTAYVCPCHTSSFTINGEMIKPTPSPRDMDSLAYEIRKSAAGVPEVWVKFENFHTGREDKVSKTA